MTGRLERIQRLEQVGFRTWPAFERTRYDGWELRVARGVTRRANSVNPLRPSSQPLDEKIDFCERWFADRGQPPVFRLAELADVDLQPTLERLGYESQSPTDVMVAPIARRQHPGDVTMERRLSDAWFSAFCAWNGRDPGQAATLRVLLESIPGQCGYASLQDRGSIAAVGLAVVDSGMAGIYNMNTDPALRRRGLGATILDALLAFGGDHGATTAFLQVLDHNAPAQRLYRAAGFERLYDYWYLERPPRYAVNG